MNDYNILSVDKDFDDVQIGEYVAEIRKLLAQGAPIQGIGIQGHLWREDILAHPEVIKERLDQIAALGLPIWITEFDVADADEQSAADKLDLVYRTAYSHPAVAGIMTWVPWAGDSWRGTNAGLARVDWTLSAAGRRFDRSCANGPRKPTARRTRTGFSIFAVSPANSQFRHPFPASRRLAKHDARRDARKNKFGFAAG